MRVLKPLVLVVLASLIVGGCGVYIPQTVSFWADVHPQGWVVFTGSRAPFPPPPNSHYGDGKLLLFHPHLNITVTLLEAPNESFSSPQWLSTPDEDRLFWVASRQKIYAMSVDFARIERMISEPLQSTLPFSLQDATLFWTEESGEIHLLSPSPDGRYLAFLREEKIGFVVVILDREATPMQKIAEIPTTWLSQIVWDPSGQAVFIVWRDPSREISLGGNKIQVGYIMRYKITSGEKVSVDEAVLYQAPSGVSGPGPGPLALSPNGQTLYYVTLSTFPPRTAQDLRLGLYSFDLASGTRQLLTELPTAETLQEIAVSPTGRRAAFTTASMRAGFEFSLQSALYLVEGTQVRQLAQQTNGWFFPLWLDDAHLMYVQFQLEMEEKDFFAGVQPALWVHNVETGERSNYLPLLTMQLQLDALRQAIQHLEERVHKLEQALQELHNKDR